MASIQAPEDATTSIPLDQLNEEAAQLIYSKLEINTIRLVYVLPGTTGPIQCKIVHHCLGEVPDREADEESDEESHEEDDEKPYENDEEFGYTHANEELEYESNEEPNEMSDVERGEETDDELGEYNNEDLDEYSSEGPENEFKYEALSYVWGSQENPAAIQLNGRDYYVTKNLEAALQQLRSPDAVRVLWIDAICINQTDVAEKNVQVRLMYRVYSQASGVIAWLGHADESSNHVMRLVMKNIKDCDSARVAWLQSRDMLEDTLAIAKLFERDYWSRLWVLQEIALAKKVTWMCGTHSVDAKSMDDIVEALTNERYVDGLAEVLKSHGRASEIGYFTDILGKGPRRLRLGEMVNSDLISSRALILRTTKCADVRDRVYGLYSLFKSRVRNLLTIDYSMDATDVFINATKAFINATGRLDMISWPKLSRMSTYKGEALQLPTWVPDWGSTNHPIPFAYLLHPRTTDSAEFELLPGNKLLCRGKRMGSIAHVQQSTTLQRHGGGPSSKVELCTLWLDLVTFYSRLERDNEAQEPDTVNMLLHTLATGITMPSCVLTHFLDSIHMNKEYLRLTQSPDIDLPYEVMGWLGEVREIHSYRSLFAIEDFIDKEWSGSMIGLASTAIKEADILCVFPGCCVPLILRPTDERNYHLVSDAYEIGLVDGESDEGFKLSSLNLELDEMDNFYIV